MPSDSDPIGPVQQRKFSMSSKDPTWISDWNPEDTTFWETKGKVTARRNLI